jgi:hypothetical protein
MSPRSKREYREGQFIYGIKMPLVMKKPPAWMNSALPMDVTASMP